MALFLVAARMHLNASTDNLGNFPEWVTVCIYLIPVGILCQFLLVLFVSLAVEWDDTAFHAKLGWPSMVHPWLHKLKYGSDFSRRCFLLCQIVIMLMIYVSSIGVVVGMFQVATPSPSIMCTLLLTLLFSLVSIMNWVVHQGEDVSLRVIQFGHGMALSVGMYQKTSMVALMMLTDRQRAIFLNPPNGKPQPWAQDVFWVITALIYFDVLLCGYMGRVGKRNKGNFGLSYYSAHPSLHVLKLFVSLVFICLVTAIVVSIFTLEVKTGLHVALSPTVMCVLTLSYIYFGAWELLEVANVARYILLWKDRTEIVKFALGACTNGMQISPLIGALCIAARMRALQITDGKGSPQAWAQQAMYASVFALIIYTVCGVLIPVLKGGVENVDATGNVNVDLKPLMGAFLVQTAKYFALVALYASVFAICASVFMITPKSADYGYHVQMSVGGIIKDFGIAVLVFVLALVLSSAKVIGLIVKYAVDGLQVRHCTLQMDKAALSVARGYVSCAGVVVNNPVYEGGNKFSSPYLMKTDLMIIHIDVWRLFTSLFKEISIIKVEISGVHVHLEKSSYGASSNIQIVLKGTPEEQAAAAAKGERCAEFKAMANQCRGSDSSAQKQEAQTKEEELNAEAKSKKTEEKSDRKLFLGLLEIDNVSATIVKTPDTLFDAEIGRLHLENMKKGDLPVEEIAKFVISSILKTLWANLPGKRLVREVLIDTFGHPGHMCSPSETPKSENETPQVQDDPVTQTR